MSISNAWICFTLAWLSFSLWAGVGEVRGQAPAERPPLVEPVYRVTSKLPAAERSPIVSGNLVDEIAQHPLDPALEMARSAKAQIDRDVQDYTCTLIKRERVDGKLLDHEYMFAKIRHEVVADGTVVKPFGVYLKFLKPSSVRNRQVIYVAGENKGNLIAKEAGLTGRVVGTVELPPTGMLAMRGNRYPITEIGVRTLVERLIEKGERDRQQGSCSVRFLQDCKVIDRNCTCLEVVHANYKPCYDFHKAKIFIDYEYNVPIRYEAFGWPAKGESEGELIEEYTYLNFKFNVGLTDLDFSRNNPEYGF